MWPARVWTSTKNEWNAQNAVWSRAFRPSTTRHLITRVLTVCQWNLSKSPVLGAKAFDCVWTSDRCRPYSVTFGYYKFIKLLIATYIYFFFSSTRFSSQYFNQRSERFSHTSAMAAARTCQWSHHWLSSYCSEAARVNDSDNLEN